jgi:hypothetical protein
MIYDFQLKNRNILNKYKPLHVKIQMTHKSAQLDISCSFLIYIHFKWTYVQGGYTREKGSEREGIHIYGLFYYGIMYCTYVLCTYLIGPETSAALLELILPLTTQSSHGSAPQFILS